MTNLDLIIKDVEIVKAILDKIGTQTGESEDIAFAKRKLNGVISNLEVSELRDIMIAHGDSKPNGDINATIGNPDSDSKATALNQETSDADAVLPCGRKISEHSSCPHLSTHGACTKIVLTSLPPKYNMCPARGHGFIECSKA